jgi:hypothetical protein
VFVVFWLLLLLLASWGRNWAQRLGLQGKSRKVTGWKGLIGGQRFMVLLFFFSFYCIVFFAVLEIELTASCLLVKHSTTELHPQSSGQTCRIGFYSRAKLGYKARNWDRSTVVRATIYHSHLRSWGDIGVSNFTSPTRGPGRNDWVMDSKWRTPVGSPGQCVIQCKLIFSSSSPFCGGEFPAHLKVERRA